MAKKLVFFLIGFVLIASLLGCGKPETSPVFTIIPNPGVLNQKVSFFVPIQNLSDNLQEITIQDSSGTIVRSYNKNSFDSRPEKKEVPAYYKAGYSWEDTFTTGKPGQWTIIVTLLMTDLKASNERFRTTFNMVAAKSSTEIVSSTTVQQKMYGAPPASSIPEPKTPSTSVPTEILLPKIAFCSGNNENTPMWDIKLMDIDGTNHTLLAKSVMYAGVHAILPLMQWSSDGKKILFTQDITQQDRSGIIGLYVMDNNGTHQKLLYTFNNSPIPLLDISSSWWSPDGNEIIFSDMPKDEDTYRIYRMNADGTNLVQLTDIKGSYGGLFPTWSCDGKLIAFVDISTKGDNNIGIMTRDGGNQTLVNLGEDIHQRIMGLTWSPDSKQIMFASDKLYVMNYDGTNIRTIKNPDTTYYHPPEWSGISLARWSPNGERIACLIGGPYEMSQIVVIKADGSDAIRLNRDEKKNTIFRGQGMNFGDFFSWSPDSKNVAFSIDIPLESYDIYVFNIDNKKITRITSEGMERNPVWSPH